MNAPPAWIRVALALALGLAAGVLRSEEAGPDRAAAVAEALREVDTELAAFEQRLKAEASPVNKAAMKTRLVVLRQRRTDLGRRFSPERCAALLADLRKDVKVTAEAPPPAIDDTGRTRPRLRLEDAPRSAVEEHRAAAEAAKARDARYHADRAAEIASQRRIEFARIDAHLARLTAEIDSTTVGDASRRAQLNLRLRELEADKRRLEMAPNPADLDRLRLEIERETEHLRR